jgi:hypothetical protein
MDHVPYLLAMARGSRWKGEMVDVVAGNRPDRPMAASTMADLVVG